MTAPAAEATKYDLKNPPPGAYWDYDEVKTDRGKTPLGEHPLLSWKEDEDGLNGAIAFYGPSGVARFINGTSLRVSAQSIVRRGCTAKPQKSDETMADEQLAFRPGARVGGQSTPESRAASSARKAAKVVSGDSMASLHEKIANDPSFRDQLRSLGIELAEPPVVETDDEDEVEEVATT